MPEPAISIGKVLGHYRILNQIGVNTLRHDPQFPTIRTAAQECRQKFLQHRPQVRK